jgi:hypothetical protein
MSYQGERLTEIADAIRQKTNTSGPLRASDFAAAILDIQTGGGEAPSETGGVVDVLATISFETPYRELQNVIIEEGETV